MSDVFFSYIKEDLPRIKQLANALEGHSGQSIFWDQTHLGQDIGNDAIENKLRTSSCVVVCWSAASVQSSRVIDQAGEGKTRGILIPVLLDKVRPPLGFRSIQAANLAGWDGNIHAQAFERLAQDISAVISSNVGVKFVQMPGGTFFMGSPQGTGFDSEHPIHEVNIQAFSMGRNLVSNQEYGRFLQANPQVDKPSRWTDSHFNHPHQPVVGVSWDDARGFCEWAGGRLPSEAEWEYAARAGTTTQYWWGEEFDKNRANSKEGGCQWCGEQTSPVSFFDPNPFGLRDTLGNVWEWVQDHWHENYSNAPIDGSPWGSDEGGAGRVVRGGSWSSNARYCRSACRHHLPSGNRSIFLGFRCARDIA